MKFTNFKHLSHFKNLFTSDALFTSNFVFKIFQKKWKVCITSSSWKSVSTTNYLKEIIPQTVPSTEIPKQLSCIIPFQNPASLIALSSKRGPQTGKITGKAVFPISHFGPNICWWAWKEIEDLIFSLIVIHYN